MSVITAFLVSTNIDSLEDLEYRSANYFYLRSKRVSIALVLDTMKTESINVYKTRCKELPLNNPVQPTDEELLYIDILYGETVVEVYLEAVEYFKDNIKRWFDD